MINRMCVVMQVSRCMMMVVNWCVVVNVMMNWCMVMVSIVVYRCVVIMVSIVVYRCVVIMMNIVVNMSVVCRTIVLYIATMMAVLSILNRT